MRFRMTIRILGPGHATNPGILLNQESYYYCQSGYDGTMDLAAFDERVGYQLEHYGDLEAKFFKYCCISTVSYL